MKIISFPVLTIYAISLIYPKIEEYIYQNEILSIIGIFIFFFSHLKRLKIKKDLIFLYFYIAYLFAVLLSSLHRLNDVDFYLFARTTTLGYSVFGFFLGEYCINTLKPISLNKITHKLRYISFISLFITEFKLTPQVFFAITSGYKISFFILGLFFFIIYKPGATGLTGILLTLFFYLWIHFKEIRKIPHKYIIVLSSFLFLFSIYFMTPLLDTFLKYGYQEINIIDNNATWRLMFWIYLFNEKFIHNPIFGIGFGSPLFDLISVPKFITSDDGTRFTEFTLGTHNSFFYTAVRLGLVGFSALVISHFKIYIKAFKQIKNISNIFEKKLLTSLILSNLLFLNSALFNVIMESPLYGFNYWFTLGMMYSFTIKILKH